MRDYDRKNPRTVTVTVLYAPSPWMQSPEELVEIPVLCTLSKTLAAVIQVDSARPMGPLPEKFLKRGFPRSLRAALQLALDQEIRPVPDGRIDWGDGS